MSHTNLSLSRLLRSMALVSAVAVLPRFALADDVDLFTGISPTNVGRANVLFILDDASAAHANVTFTCPAPGSSISGNQMIQFDQCALYNAVAAIGGNPSLVGKLNMGLMAFGSPSPGGGQFYYPNANPSSLPMMDAAGVSNFESFILGTVGSLTAPKSQVAGSMQEAWAFYTSNVGVSGTSYHTIFGPCQKNFVIYIADARVSGKPQDNSNGQATLAAAGASAAQQTQIAINSKYASNWGDEWARFMYQGPVGNNNPQNIITYTIAVDDQAHPNVDYDNFVKSMADHGGGKFFSVQVGDTSALTAALTQIFNEVQAVNSVFASVSLPVNVNAQGTYSDQIYAGMFRPDAQGNPRWVGNLKQYKMGFDSSNNVVLEDATGAAAISNSGTGFISPNALSYWTADHYTGTPNDGPFTVPSGTSVVANWPSGGFWVNSPSGTGWTYDAPDGEIVEKGGAAEMARADYLTTATQANRTVYTCNGVGSCPTSQAMPTFDTNNNWLTGASGQSAFFGSNTPSVSVTSLIAWIRGNDNIPLDTQGAETEQGPGAPVAVRASIHGDVLHSRPAIVNYYNTTTQTNNIVAYYGSNDGFFRAVNGNRTGVFNGVRPGGELWSFIAPEFLSKFPRQHDNSPQLKLANTPSGITPLPMPKDYFFDGTTTVYQDLRVPASPKVYIYLTARRGGRLIYAMNVTDPANPRFLWKRSNSDIAELGQTWSQPKVALVKGYTDSNGVGIPVLIMGAGYDTAEDNDPYSTSTPDSQGRGIIMLDAITGQLVWAALPSCTGVAAPAKCIVVSGMTRSIPADITLLDRNADGYIDRLYAADLGGNIWRVDLEPTAGTAPANWVVTKLASLASSGGNNERKFFYPPDVVPTSTYDAVTAASGDREKPLYSSPSVEGTAYNVTNRFYMLKDTNTGNNVANGWTAITENNLFDASAAVYSATSPSPASTSTNSGFFVTLTNKGEKAVNAPLTVAGYTYFGTNQPFDPTANPNVCYPNLGIARGYAISFTDATGLNSNRNIVFAGGGLPPSPVFGLVQIPSINGGMVLTPVLIGGGNQTSGAGGNDTSTLGSQKITPPGTGHRKRTYWYIDGVK
ncbi:pilus assembly protein [Dyella subtropica]|uniref:pilus assembly protein n=1 Tax=Dyella subtropica TaxID=2992127 RepID=UPI00224EC5D7|nr:PilC/PilY family type IV pilus protein [Dyella subtropica]